MLSPDLTVRTYRGGYGAHEHAHAQVLVGLRGRLLLEVDGRPAVVDAASALVVPAGASHSYLAEAPASVLVLDCAPARATERLRRFVPPPQWGQAGPLPSAQAVLAVLPFAASLQVRRGLDLTALARAIEAELHHPWTVADLAARCHFSPQRFRARFAELTGVTPLAWVRRMRLDTAERELRAGRALEAVALQVGYASASALSFALKRDRDTGARRLRRP